LKGAHCALLLGASALPAHAGAHGFGARYDLPIPLSFYLTGAALTVALSFALLALAPRSTAQATRVGRTRAWRLQRGLAVARLLGVAVYVLVVCAGLFGVQSPL